MGTENSSGAVCQILVARTKGDHMGHFINFRCLIQPNNFEEIHANWNEAKKQTEQGTPYEIQIRRPRRTNPQNDMWHQQLRRLSNVTGHTLEECKDAVKQEVLGIDIIEIGSKKYSRPPSSADLPMDMMSLLIERTQQIIHELQR